MTLKNLVPVDAGSLYAEDTANKIHCYSTDNRSLLLNGSKNQTVSWDAAGKLILTDIGGTIDIDPGSWGNQYIWGTGEINYTSYVTYNNILGFVVIMGSTITASSKYATNSWNTLGTLQYRIACDCSGQVRQANSPYANTGSYQPQPGWRIQRGSSTVEIWCPGNPLTYLFADFNSCLLPIIP